MLSIESARALSRAGLVWQPVEFDFFAVPDRGLDDRRFVVSDMPATIGPIQGESAVSFEGAGEWALDYVLTGDVLWLPTEEQLRGRLAARLAAEPRFFLALQMSADGCRCEILWGGQTVGFQAAEASEAYAAALLHTLAPGAVR